MDKFRFLKSSITKAADLYTKVTSETRYYELEDLSPSAFEIRSGNRITLFQDAHCEGDYPSQIIKDDGGLDFSYSPQNCFEQIYAAILNAKRFIYITGWSVDTKISLLRRTPIFYEEGSDAQPKKGKMTIGELLLYKVAQGIRVLLHVWDEALSVDISGYSTAGIMCTYDEETKKFFGGTGVECKLSYRTGSTRDNQFLWTHHQKSVIVDAAPIEDSLYGSVSLISSCPYVSANEYSPSVQQMISNLAQSENDYARKDKDGNRYAISSFMTVEHDFLKIWDDNGAGCTPHKVSIFRPVPAPGWYALGDFAHRNLEPYPDRFTKVMVVKEPPAIEGETPILACPIGYGRVWPTDDCFHSDTGDIVFWEPIAPDGYEALGFVATTSNEEPYLDLIRCVHRDALEKAHAATEEDQRPIWKNKGSARRVAGESKVSIWKIIPSGSGLVSGTFVVRGGHRLPTLSLQDRYWCLKTPPLGTEVCPKPSDLEETAESNQYSSNYSESNVDIAPVGKRRIIAFVGGLDLTNGRWDTPSHPLFRTLDTEHKTDFLHGWGLQQCFGPREPWHDIHSKLEGPIARDIMTNFEQRWRKQAGTPLFHVGREFISIQEEEIHDDNSWCSRLCRSIDPFSADISYVDNSIQRHYVEAIRKAQRFIYIENQYFMGSSKHWLENRSTGCMNLIPYEIAKRIAESIAIDFYPIVAYILIPLYPEGYPADGAIQEQLRWQWNSMVMMYDIIREALEKKGKNASPTDFLKFMCVGQREDISLSRAERSDAPADSNESLLFVSRRVPIYVHSKMMIIDDEYIILGSANINERSMAGNRDSEIAVESWQPKHFKEFRPRGGVHKFRMSLWAEHAGESFEQFLQPNTPECVRKITEICERNWEIFTGEIVVNMKSHLMRYPIRWHDGKLISEPTNFPDTTAPVKGCSSLAMPDLLTC